MLYVAPERFNDGCFRGALSGGEPSPPCGSPCSPWVNPLHLRVGSQLSPQLPVFIRIIMCPPRNAAIACLLPCKPIRRVPRLCHPAAHRRGGGRTPSRGKPRSPRLLRGDAGRAAGRDLGLVHDLRLGHCSRHYRLWHGHRQGEYLLCLSLHLPKNLEN